MKRIIITGLLMAGFAGALILTGCSSAQMQHRVVQ